MAFAFDDYVGIPWLDRGRDLCGCDCWGLHRLILLDAAAIELPSYAEAYAGVADRRVIAGLIAGSRGDWRQVPAAEARAFDTVLMHDRPWHVGTVVRAGRMLHVPEGRASVIEPFTTGRFGRLVEGIYRHEALA